MKAVEFLKTTKEKTKEIHKELKSTGVKIWNIVPSASSQFLESDTGYLSVSDIDKIAQLFGKQITVKAVSPFVKRMVFVGGIEIVEIERMN